MQYGLTEEEQATHLQAYNHALFQNSMSFLDVVCEINLPHKTVAFLEDRIEPNRTGKEFLYEDFYQDHVSNRVKEEDLEFYKAHFSFQALQELKTEEILRLRFRASDGEWHLFRIALTPSFDADGNLFCIYYGALDLHEEERQALSNFRIQEQFQDALGANCYFSFELDVTEGGLIKKEYMARDGSYPIRESTGKSAPVIYKDWVDKWYELYEPQFERQEQENIFDVNYFLRAFARNERVLDVEVKQRSPRTGKIEFMHIFVLLLENPEDKHIRARVIWRDISEFRSGVIEDRMNLQSANDELKQTVSREEQFQRAALSGALMVYNINLTKNLIEREFYEIVDGTSYPMLELVGLKAPCNFDTFCRRWSEQKVPEDSREVFRRMYNRQYLLDCYARGEYQLEIEFDTVIGRGIPITLRNTTLLVKNEESGDILAMVNGRDVTKQRLEEREKREALQAAYEVANRANTAKSDFLARMSHDIRTPMNAIVGMTAIAATHLDDPERVADCLNKISISSKHLLGLINEVLDMSKIESGKIDLQEEEFSLPDLLDNLLTMCKPQTEAKGHELTVSIHSIHNEKVIGDSQRIQRVFMNLMSNAIKYTPPGGKISLSISEKPTNRPRIGCYEFVFEDNGIGMSEEFQQHLFQPFERAEDARASKEQGTGLGLTISRNIVQMMNGTIEVESELDKGTKFTVTIFLKLQADENDSDCLYLANLPVLVADDDISACEATCELLDELGMKSEWVLSGQEAVERVSAHHQANDDFYAVILDWKMPEMDGLATAREIRKRVGDEIPIIILSAYDWSEIEQEARSAGVNAFIGKPLFRSRMVYLFNDLFGHRQEDEKKNALAELEEEDFSGRRALIAEDNDLNAEIALEIFGMIGLETERAENGKEALDMIAQAPDGYYDIVFMDIQMPVMNGYDAVRAIRSLDRDYAKQVPILAMSANAFAEDVEASHSAGMNEHIAKPLDFDQLKRALEKWIR